MMKKLIDKIKKAVTKKKAVKKPNRAEVIKEAVKPRGISIEVSPGVFVPKGDLSKEDMRKILREKLRRK